MQRKYVTKKLVKRISTITNDIYRQSSIIALNLSPNVFEEEIEEAMVLLRYAHLSTYEATPELKAAKERSDVLYLEMLIKLPTPILEDILFLHDYSKPKRALRTIEAITSELARRFIMDDSSKSDDISNNGDLHAKKQSRVNSKKTKSKRDKASKGR
jgi:hypothetical protein